MSEYPYGTSGICRNTEHWIIEGHAAMEEYHASLATLPPPTVPGLLKPDAVGIHTTVIGAEGRLAGQVGFEYIYNLHTADLTQFLVIGGGGAGAVVAGDVTFVLVYNIEDRNLDYSGNFVSLGAAGADVIGVSGQYSITPEDARSPLSFFRPQRAYSISLGGACGVGAAGFYGATEYLPVLTTNFETHETTFHFFEYLHDPDDRFDNGFITGLATEDLPRYYRSIQDFLEERGWD